MQTEHQMRSQAGNTRREVEVLSARDEMQALPRWESFPLDNRHHLVGMILQTARRQVAARPANTPPTR
jgi:hypothetical protein